MSPKPPKGPSGRIRKLRSLVTDLRREDVIQAIRDFHEDNEILPSFNDSTGYDLLYDGEHYPPKPIFALAVARIFGRPLTSDEFSGGEKSPCFRVLDALEFDVVSKRNASASSRLPDGLLRYSQYDREDIAELFDPDANFKAGTGTWGLQGIVETPSGSGNFVFMVTLGEPKEGNPYHDEITEDGYLIWESQTRHSFKSKTIQKLFGHDTVQNDIHLFVRPTVDNAYTYFGLLEYFSHDPNAEHPIHFVWSILGWNIGKSELQTMGFPYRQALDPSFTPQITTSSKPTLVEENAPKASGKTKTNSDAKKTGAKGNIDWAAKDERNRRLGLKGEEIVLHHEKLALINANRTDLAVQVTHVALTIPSAGFDIASFYIDGRPKLIEVKTTQGPASTPFFISANEIRTSSNNQDNYCIYRIYEFTPGASTVSFYVLEGTVDEKCDLEATNFRALPK